MVLSLLVCMYTEHVWHYKEINPILLRKRQEPERLKWKISIIWAWVPISKNKQRLFLSQMETETVWLCNSQAKHILTTGCAQCLCSDTALWVKSEKMQLLMCGRTMNFKTRFMKPHAPWPSLITTARWTFSRWMVYIFIYDTPFSNHNISYKLDKLSSHLTGRKVNINCSKGHSIQLCSVLNCHQIWTVISSITHLTRMFQNLEINCLPCGKKMK